MCVEVVLGEGDDAPLLVQVPRPDGRSVPPSNDRVRSRRAQFGALPGGGVTRSCWSPAHEKARAWLLGEIRAAGLTAWVDPAVHLWNRSLLENLLYGSDDSALAFISETIEQSNLTDVIKKLPNGLKTLLGESGALVSGGEGQRVRLARALVRPNVRLAILDEPFRGLGREQRRAGGGLHPFPRPLEERFVDVPLEAGIAPLHHEERGDDCDCETGELFAPPL